MRTSGFALTYAKDFGDWGYAAVLPVSQTENNSLYSPLNHTQVSGILAPTYHVFIDQVHGMTLDLGGSLGYSSTTFSDLSALRSATGPYTNANLSNFNTSFVGLNASLGKQIGSATGLSLGLNVVSYRNEGAETTMGSTGTMLGGSVGLSQMVTSNLSINGALNFSQLKQHSFNSVTHSNTLGLGMNYRIGNRSSLALNLGGAVDAKNVKTSTFMLTFKYELN
jgi:hypothetical protein